MLPCPPQAHRTPNWWQNRISIKSIFLHSNLPNRFNYCCWSNFLILSSLLKDGYNQRRLKPHTDPYLRTQNLPSNLFHVLKYCRSSSKSLQVFWNWVLSKPARLFHTKFPPSISVQVSLRPGAEITGGAPSGSALPWTEDKALRFPKRHRWRNLGSAGRGDLWWVHWDSTAGWGRGGGGATTAHCSEVLKRRWLYQTAPTNTVPPTHTRHFHLSVCVSDCHTLFPLPPHILFHSSLLAGSVHSTILHAASVFLCSHLLLLDVVILSNSANITPVGPLWQWVDASMKWGSTLASAGWRMIPMREEFTGGCRRTTEPNKI